MQASADLLPEGRILAERYVVKERLGAGGMGTVYRAVDLKLGVDIAIKVFRAERFGGAVQRERSLREVRLARLITHPNVCRVFDVVEEGAILFLTMELVQGGPLRALLQAGQLPFSRAIHLWEQIARGVAAAHEKAVVHRDLKPENVLVQPDGRAKVVDFGLATGTGADATLPGFAGTPAYMSPEQLRGEALDARSDVFSLGVIGHELLTGRHPFGDGPPALVTSAILRDPPRLTDVPAPAATILERSMAKRREERFASAAELLNAVAEMGRGVSQPSSRATPFIAISPQGRPSAGASPRKPPMRTKPVLAAVLGTLAAVLAAFILGESRHEEPSPPVPPLVPTPVPIAPSPAPQTLESPRVVVSTFRDLLGSTWSADLARSAEESVRAGLRAVKGISVAVSSTPGDWVVLGSVQRAGDVVRIQLQIDTGAEMVGTPFDIQGANDPQLLDSLRDRVIDEVRILLRDHERRVRAARETRSDTARKALLDYYDLVGPAPQPHHVDAGMSLLNHALGADPSYPSAYVARAYLRLLRASLGDSREDLEAAKRDIQTLRELAPADARAAVLHCRWARFSTTFETVLSDDTINEVKQICDEALRADQASASVRIDLAKLHEQTCDEDHAIDLLDRALPLDRAKAGEVLRHRAELAFKRGNLPLAERSSQELVRFQEEEARAGPGALSVRAGVPPTRGAHWLRGSILLRQGRRSEARAAFKRELQETHFEDEPIEAGTLRGLFLTLPRGDGTARDIELQLRSVESRFVAKAAREPSVVLDLVGAYMFTDPQAALEWLDRAGQPSSCSDALYRALVHRVAGNDAAVRRTLSACKHPTRWEERCIDSLGGRSK